MRLLSTIVVCACVTLLGCGGSSGGGGSSNGTTGGTDGGTVGGTSQGLTINASTGLTLSPDLVLTAENPIFGVVDIQIDGNDPAAAVTVTLNGKALVPILGSTSLYEVDKADAPTIAPGGTMTIKATSGSATETLTFTCPSFTMATSPDTGVTPGGTVTVSWSGNVYDNPTLAGLLYDPVVSIAPHSASSAAFASPGSAQRATPASPAASAAVTAPSSASSTGFLVQLTGFGQVVMTKNAQGGQHDGICGLVRRKVLTSL
jgi:hypothetical protein